jgi:cytochrome P450
MVINETLRLNVPGTFSVPAFFAETTEISGYTIRKDMKFTINFAAIHGDP